LPPPLRPPPENFSGRTQALGAKAQRRSAQRSSGIRDRIEALQQGEDLFRIVPGGAGDELGRRQSVGRRLALRTRRRGEEAVAGLGRHARRAAGERVRERGEVGQGRRLRTVQSVSDCGAVAASRKIDKVVHVAGGDAEAQRWPLDRHTVEKLRVGPYGRDGRHLVDDDLSRRRAAQHRQKGERRIVAAALVDCRDAARLIGAQRKAPVIGRFRLGQLPRVARAPGP